MSNSIRKVIFILCGYAQSFACSFFSKPVLVLMMVGVIGIVFYAVGTWLHHYNIGQLMKGYKLDSAEKYAAPFLQVFGIFLLIVVAVFLYFVGAYDRFFSIFN